MEGYRAAAAAPQIGVLLLAVPWLCIGDARLAKRMRPGVLAYDVQRTFQDYHKRVMEVLAPGAGQGKGLKKGLGRGCAWQALQWVNFKASLSGFFARMRQRLHW